MYDGTAVRADPSPAPADALGGAASGCRSRTRTRSARRRRRCSRRPGRARDGCGSRAPAGPGRSARTASRPRSSVRRPRARRPGGAARGLAVLVRVPWVRNERSAVAGLKTTSYAENVVALARAYGAGRRRGGPRQHGRRPVRGHGLERLRRARRRAADAAAVERVPGGHHPRARCSSGRRRRACRCARRRRGSCGTRCSRRCCAGRAHLMLSGSIRNVSPVVAWTVSSSPPGRSRCERSAMFQARLADDLDP